VRANNEAQLLFPAQEETHQRRIGGQASSKGRGL